MISGEIGRDTETQKSLHFATSDAIGTLADMGGNGFESRTGYSVQNRENPCSDAGFGGFSGGARVARSTRHSTRQCETLAPRKAGSGGLIIAWWVALIFLVAAILHHAEHATATPTTACAQLDTQHQRTRCIIRATFRQHGASAVRVAWCESRLDPRARNGQYRGLFQLGAAERARYGHGRTVLAQARAARRLFNARGWQPWTCKP